MSFLRVLGPVVLAAGVVVACGGSDADDDDTASSSGASGDTTSGGASGASGNTTSSGSSGASSTGSSGAPGTCTPGEKSACSIDPCSPGEALCNAEGTGFGACQGEVRSCTGATEYSLRYGNTGNTSANEQISGAAGLADGSRYVVGNYSRDLDFGTGGLLPQSGNPSGFVAKLGADGNVSWSRAPTATSVKPLDVATDSAGNVTVVGEFHGTIDFGNGPLPSDADYMHAFVASWFSNGNLRWAKIFGTGPTNHRASSVAVTPDGAVVVGGSFAGAINLGGNQLTAAGNTDAFVAKFDADGNHVWSRRFGDVYQQYVTAVAVDPVSGDAFVGSEFAGVIDFGGGPISFDNAEGYAIARLASADGAYRWAKPIAACDGGTLGVRRAPAGNLIVYSDAFVNDVDFGAGAQRGILLASYDATGTLQWGKAFESSFEPHGAAIDSSGSIVLAGSFYDEIDLGAGPILSFQGSQDALFAKFSDAGTLIWARAIGDSDQQSFSQTGAAVTFGADLRPTVFGWFEGNINFGDHELVSGAGFGGSDLFVAQLAP